MWGGAVVTDGELNFWLAIYSCVPIKEYKKNNLVSEISQSFGATFSAALA